MPRKSEKQKAFEKSAFYALVNQEYEKLLEIARRMVGPEHEDDAADVLHDTILDMLEKNCYTWRALLNQMTWRAARVRGVVFKFRRGRKKKRPV